MKDNHHWLNIANQVHPGSHKLDVEGSTFTVEWKKTDILSSELADFKKKLCELAAEELSISEHDFLKTHPEAASSELFLRACKPHLDQGLDNTNWNEIKETIRSSVKQFYMADLSKFGPEIINHLLNDVYFCVTLTNDRDRKVEGFLLFAVTPALPFGDVKVINFFNQNTKLASALMSIIFKILPETRRIFLFTRPTDTKNLNLYHSLGFREDLTPFQDPQHKINSSYLTCLDYRVEQNLSLQAQVN